MERTDIEEPYDVSDWNGVCKDRRRESKCNVYMYVSKRLSISVRAVAFEEQVCAAQRVASCSSVYVYVKTLSPIFKVVSVCFCL